MYLMYYLLSSITTFKIKQHIYKVGYYRKIYVITLNDCAINYHVEYIHLGQQFLLGSISDSHRWLKITWSEENKLKSNQILCKMQCLKHHTDKANTEVPWVIPGSSRLGCLISSNYIHRSVLKDI